MTHDAPLLPRMHPGDVLRWERGVDGPPRVGDLWVASWDGVDLGLVLLAAVRPSFVLVWPVTDMSEAVSAPCFHVDADWLTTDLVAWPEAEAGMSKAVLARRLGAAVRDRTTAEFRAALADGEQLPDVRLAPIRDDEIALRSLERVCVLAAALCDIEWTAPVPGESPIDREWASANNVTALALAEIMDGSVGVTRDIMAGERVAPESAVLELAQRMGVDPADVVAPITGLEARELDNPRRKARIVELAARRQLSEKRARTEAWQYSLRAARQQTQSAHEDAAARVDRALDDLLSGHSG